MQGQPAVQRAQFFVAAFRRCGGLQNLGHSRIAPMQSLLNGTRSRPGGGTQIESLIVRQREEEISLVHHPVFIFY